MDTPGVLARPDAERNPMEGLTLAAAQLLPAALVFVMDLSGDNTASRKEMTNKKTRRACGDAVHHASYRSRNFHVAFCRAGTCGDQSSPALQLAVRERIRAQFADRPWIDVRSKAEQQQEQRPCISPNP